MLGGAFWVLTVVFLVGQVIAQSAWKGLPAYSVLNERDQRPGSDRLWDREHRRYPAYCSPLHDVMNASFS